ncbi:MAG: hypothetical protein RLP44_27670 [Aggregatilineales bacterium]
MRGLILLSVLLIAGFTTVRAQSEEAPYIYYHSEVLNAIVIERADGSDSRMIAQDVMPENHTIVSGPGWSPSGRWFAWTSTYSTEYYQSPSKIWLISADGSRRITLLDEVSHAAVASWSPTEDYLFVMDANSDNFAVGSGTSEKPGHEAYLVDANNERPVAFFDDILVDIGEPFDAWSENGQSLYFSGSDYQLGENGEAIVGSRFRRTLHLDGHYEDRELVSGYGRSPEPEFHVINQPDSVNITLENQTLSVERDSETSLSFDLPSENIGLMEWSPSGDYALFYHWSPCEDGFCPDSLNLLSLPDEELFQLSDMVRPFSNYSLWTFDQDRAVFQTGDGHVQVLDAQTQTITTVPMPDDTDFEESISAFWDIKTSDLLRISARDEENHNYRYYDYDINTGELILRESIYDTPFYIVEFSPSPNNRYLASYFERTITNTETGSVTQTRPYSGYADDAICSYRWHPESQWLMREDNMVFAGGGCRGGVMVMKVDGTVQRELGKCTLNYQQNCAGWLPANVIPHLAEGQSHSVVPEPILTIQHEGYVLGVGWSANGELLAVYEGQENDEYLLNIWAIEQENASLIYTFPVNECYEWLFFECAIHWNPSGTQIAVVNIGNSQIINASTGEIILTTEEYFAGWLNDTDYILTDYISTYDSGTNRMARYDGESRIEVVDVTTNDVIYALEGDDYRWLSSVSFMPEQNYLAMVINPDDPTINVRVYDLDTGEVIDLPKLDLDFQTDVTTIEDYVVGYGRATLIYFWDIETASVVMRINRYSSGIDFSSDGHYLATASSTVAEIWDFDAIAP